MEFKQSLFLCGQFASCNSALAELVAAAAGKPTPFDVTRGCRDRFSRFRSPKQDPIRAAAAAVAAPVLEVLESPKAVR